MSKAVLKKSGFTLIETLLAILIFSIIAMSLYASFAAGTKLNQAIDRKLRSQKEALWALEQMGQDLENMVAYDFSGSYPDTKNFLADQKTISFFLPTGKGLKAVRYTIESFEEGDVRLTKLGITTKKNVTVTNTTTQSAATGVLLREEKDFTEFLQNGFEGADAEIMIRSVPLDGLKVSYRTGVKDEKGELTWAEEWKKDTLPQGVRIELTAINADDQSKATFLRDIFNPAGELYEN